MARLPAALAHPVRILPLTFLALIVVGTLLLLLPFTHHGDASVMAALFTSTSAVTVTGLASVDTATHWTVAGQWVILVLCEIGGIGIIAMASILGIFAGGRLGLRTRLAVQADMHVTTLGEVRPLFRRVVLTTFGFQAVLLVVLTLRYWLGYDHDLSSALWHGAFDSVMAFNNAGFSLNSDSITRYAGDVLVIIPMSIAVFIGAMGFPVLAELYREWRTPDRWTIHTRLTVWGSFLLLFVGAAFFLLYEWNNPATLGPLGFTDKLVTGIEGGIMPRSGGLNSFDWGAVNSETLNISTVMMFIGGGSASTAGGIKITTFLLLAFVILAELRGDPDVTIGRRSINPVVIRQALTIALLAVMLVAVGAILLLSMTPHSFEDVLFESASAFGTTGLSTGLTPTLGADGQLVLVGLMFVGRIGTITAVSALVLRRRAPRYHYPQERPIIG